MNGFSLGSLRHVSEIKERRLLSSSLMGRGTSSLVICAGADTERRGDVAAPEESGEFEEDFAPRVVSTTSVDLACRLNLLKSVPVMDQHRLSVDVDFWIGGLEMCYFA